MNFEQIFHSIRYGEIDSFQIYHLKLFADIYLKFLSENDESFYEKQLIERSLIKFVDDNSEADGITCVIELIKILEQLKSPCILANELTYLLSHILGHNIDIAYIGSKNIRFKNPLSIAHEVRILLKHM
ncbi:hypothetical protein L3V83_13425 [Thiotrichales bacterium 19X7-9]|nr:hypothetical protein [Thiotrichales bacterium 19X7-9]